jgi:aspartate 1-decarboxylase
VFRTLMRAKVHGATLTQANLHYSGSLTLDSGIMDQLGMLPSEQVQVLNLNNGSRLITYLIAGEKGSGVVALNGAAARLGQPGDKVLIVTYAVMSEEEARQFRPKVALVDERNRVVEILEDTPLPASPLCP